MKAITVTLLVMMLVSCGPVVNSGKKLCDGMQGIRKAASLARANEAEMEKKQQADQPILLYRMLINM